MAQYESTQRQLLHVQIKDLDEKKCLDQHYSHKWGGSAQDPHFCPAENLGVVTLRGNFFFHFGHQGRKCWHNNVC